MKLHLFYPENDLALASGLASYTAPKQARRLSEAGKLLPLHYGDEGDLAVCDGAIMGRQGAVRLSRDLLRLAEPEPWGWSAAVRSQYLALGIDAERLPGDEELERWRMMSHRRTGAMVARRLQAAMPGLRMPAPAIEAHTESELRDAVERFGQAMVKAPWSCSGRGVASTLALGTDQACRIGADAMRKQGSVMVEPLMDNVLDFAKIFRCAEGRCECLGTSVFATDALGRYAGNLLAPEPVREARVGEVYPLGMLRSVTEALRLILEEEIAPGYDGIVGVDMLVDRSGMLHPVVEVNLRKTMGYVALRLSDRLLAPGVEGVVRAVPLDREQLSPRACTIASGRLAKGTMLLSPPTPHFAFVAEVK